MLLAARVLDVVKFSCYSQVYSVPQVGLKSRNGGPCVPVLPVPASSLFHMCSSLQTYAPHFPLLSKSFEANAV